MQNLKIEFTDKELTPWGGMVLLKQMLDQTGLKKFLRSNSHLPQPGSNRGYQPADIIESFLVSVWCGSNRFLHTEILRQDSPLKKIFQWKRTPGQDVYKRFFKKFTQKKNHEFFNSLSSWYFSQLQFTDYTLDFDSTIMTRYGKQEGAKSGAITPASAAEPPITHLWHL